MSRSDGCRLHVFLYEGPGSAPLSDPQRLAILTSLLERGYAVSRVACACGVAVTDTAVPVLLGQFDGGPPPLVVGTDGETQAHTCDICALDADGVAAQLERIREEVGARKPGGWKPWFPVIDYDRCTGCKQCLSFCLFDVYGTDTDGETRVENPANCKTDCPACARVCPSVAIMFPKYPKAPVNGDVVREEDIQSEATRVDVGALLAGDAYEALRKRSGGAKKRFSTDRGRSRALFERERCVKEAQGEGSVSEEIPTDESAGDAAEDRIGNGKATPCRCQACSAASDGQQPPRPEDEWGI